MTAQFIGSNFDVLKFESKNPGMALSFILEYSTDGQYLYTGVFSGKDKPLKIYPFHAADLAPVLEVGGVDHCSF